MKGFVFFFGVLQVEVLDKIKVNQEQLKEIKEQLTTLTEMDECLHSDAIGCYQILLVPVDEKTSLSYWIRIIKSEDGFEIELLKEELFS